MRPRLGGLGPLGSSRGVLLGGRGRLLARSGRLLEPSLGPRLGLPGARLGLIWASRGAPSGASWASVEGSLANARRPRTSTTVQHFLRFVEVPGAPKSF